jgi:hypothetical protein
MKCLPGAEPSGVPRAEHDVMAVDETKQVDLAVENSWRCAS